MTMTTRILIYMIAGLVLGSLINAFAADVAFIQDYLVNGLFHVVGAMFITGLKMLVVPLVTDVDDAVPLIRHAPHLVMDLGHQGAGGVDGLQAAGGGLLADGRRDAVGAEDDRGDADGFIANPAL